MLNNTNIYYFKDNFSITLPKNIGEEDIKWKELSWELELTTAGNNIYKVAPKGNNSNNIIFADDGVIVEVVNHNLEVGEVWCMLRLNVEKDVKRYVFAAGIYLSGDNGYSTEDNQQIIVDTSNVIKPDIVSAVLEYDKEEGEINVPTNIQPINYRRSFSVTLYLKVGDTLLSGTSANWRAIFTTVGSKYYECYHRNGRLKNCVINDDGSIRILFENHELEVGVLWCEIGIISDDEEFKECRRDNLVRVPTGLELVSGYDDIGIDLDLDIVMPYVYVDAYTMAKNAGFTGTREEYIESLVNLKEYIDKGNTGGGGTGGGMSVSQMWAELAKKATSTSQIIDDSHIPSSVARITDLPDMTKYVEKGDMGDFLTKDDLKWKNITD